MVPAWDFPAREARLQELSGAVLLWAGVRAEGGQGGSLGERGLAVGSREGWWGAVIGK